MNWFRKIVAKIKMWLIARDRKYRVKFMRDMPLSGLYDGDNRVILLSSRLGYVGLVNAFCHEMGHAVDHSDGLFEEYYSPKSLKKVLRVALKAERSADKTGAKICRTHFPGVKFEKSYDSRESAKFLKDYYTEGWKTRRKK